MLDEENRPKNHKQGHKIEQWIDVVIFNLSYSS